MSPQNVRVTDKTLVFGGEHRQGLGQIRDIDAIADVTVARRQDTWWMALGGRAGNAPVVNLYSASLPAGATLGNPNWSIAASPDDRTQALPLAPAPPPDAWDATGYHCASYACGPSPPGGYVERLYYASSSNWTSIAGPYSIGLLEWDGDAWIRHPEPVFTAALPWERGTVFEPNLIYHDGLWRMWYCAGLSDTEPQVIGYAESPDGVTGWTSRRIASTAEEYDAAVAPGRRGYDMITARLSLLRPQSTGDGLYWAHAESLSAAPDAWSPPQQILATIDGTPWHAGGAWKPTLCHDQDQLYVFFNGRMPLEGSYQGQLTVGRIRCETT